MSAKDMEKELEIKEMIDVNALRKMRGPRKGQLTKLDALSGAAASRPQASNTQGYDPDLRQTIVFLHAHSRSHNTPTV